MMPCKRLNHKVKGPHRGALEQGALVAHSLVAAGAVVTAVRRRRGADGLAVQFLAGPALVREVADAIDGHAAMDHGVVTGRMRHVRETHRLRKTRWQILSRHR